MIHRSSRRGDSPKPLKISPLESLSDVETAWNQSDILELPNQVSKKFVTGIAASDRGVEAALRLRYEIFNVELGHGIASSEKTGLDRDRFDDQMLHLLLLDRETREVIGTYRIQTVERALEREGLYSAQEYDMTALEDHFDLAAETGRACIAADYRKATSLLALWNGIHTFMAMSDKRWLFGCCSVSSHDPDDGWRVMKTLRRNNFMHPSILLPPTPEHSCGPPSRENAPDIGEPLALPKLFAAYMRLGVKVMSLPAIDREFGTIDFLCLADAHSVRMSSMVL